MKCAPIVFFLSFTSSMHHASCTVAVSMTVNGDGDTFDILLTKPFDCIGSMKLTLN